MEKKDNSKIIVCLYIIIAILILNTICHFIEISKLSTKNSTTTTQTNTKTSNSSYDVSMFEDLSPSQITAKIKNGDAFVLYIGQESCTYCQKMLPTLQQAQEDFGYTTVYLNVASGEVTSSNEFKEMSKLLDVTMTANGETKEFGEFQLTPMIAVIRGGKMIDGMIGYNTYENFAEFLTNSGIQKK